MPSMDKLKKLGKSVAQVKVANVSSCKINNNSDKAVLKC